MKNLEYACSLLQDVFYEGCLLIADYCAIAAGPVEASGEFKWAFPGHLKLWKGWKNMKQYQNMVVNPIPVALGPFAGHLQIYGLESEMCW